MKQNNQYIQDFAKKLFHHKQGMRSAQLMSPKRDWLLGVFVGLLIMISMVGWSAYTYIEKRDAIGLSETDMQAQIPVYRSDVVDDAIELFAIRKETFAELNQSSAPVVTPVETLDDVTSTTTATTTINQLEVAEDANMVTGDVESQNITPELTPEDQPLEDEESLGSPTLVN